MHITKCMHAHTQSHICMSKVYSNRLMVMCNVHWTTFPSLTVIHAVIHVVMHAVEIVIGSLLIHMREVNPAILISWDIAGFQVVVSVLG